MYCGISKSSSKNRRFALAGKKEFSQHPMKLFRWYRLLPWCVVLTALLAVSPGVAQEAPELRSLPVHPHGNAIERPEGAIESSPELPPALKATESTHHSLPNGLDVTVYGSELLESRLTWYGGDAIIPLDDGRYLSVITDINDASIYNKGDGRFHPFPEDRVLEILKGVSHDKLDLDVTVYILPFPRTNLLVSSTSGNTVFLSPHVRDIHPEVCAYIVAHELGHVFHNAYMPDGSGPWETFLRIRRITDEYVFYANATHAYRPKEIFAEDFRVLFGGFDAAFGGRIENPELPSPTLVAGLEEFIAGIGGPAVIARAKVRVTSYPNPFNPETEIRVIVPEEIVRAQGRVTVRIYDVSGALVRELYSAVPFGDNLYVRWDGRDENGNGVASANYFALIEAGQARATLKLVLLK